MGILSCAPTSEGEVACLRYRRRIVLVVYPVNAAASAVDGVRSFADVECYATSGTRASRLEVKVLALAPESSILNSKISDHH